MLVKKNVKKMFLQACGALNFGLTGLGVTGHGKGPLKLKKYQNCPQKCLVPLFFSTHRTQDTVHTVFIEAIQLCWSGLKKILKIEKSCYFVEDCHFSKYIFYINTNII